MVSFYPLARPLPHLNYSFFIPLLLANALSIFAWFEFRSPRTNCMERTLSCGGAPLPSPLQGAQVGLPRRSFPPGALQGPCLRGLGEMGIGRAPVLLRRVGHRPRDRGIAEAVWSVGPPRALWMAPVWLSLGPASRLRTQRKHRVVSWVFLGAGTSLAGNWPRVFWHWLSARPGAPRKASLLS